MLLMKYDHVIIILMYDDVKSVTIKASYLRCYKAYTLCRLGLGILFNVGRPLARTLPGTHSTYRQHKHTQTHIQ